MGSRRTGTVHDLVSLKLSQNGVLNQPNSKLSRNKSVQSARGQWAANIVGNFSVPKDYKFKVEEATSNSSSTLPKGYVDEDMQREAQDGEDSMDNQRARRRRKVDLDLEFMNDHVADTERNQHGGEDLPLPSSDLLKNIHYFTAAAFHTSDDIRKGVTSARRQRSVSERGRPRPNLESDGEVSLGEDEQDIGKAQESRSEDSEIEVSKSENRDPERDMYQVFDGKALITIGMLLQEFVKSQLLPAAPQTRDDVAQWRQNRSNSRSDDYTSDSASDHE